MSYSLHDVKQNSAWICAAAPRGAAQDAAGQARDAAAEERLGVPASPDFALKNPDLYAAWRKHIEQGFENNQTMFSRVLKSFMNPYWITVWLYGILFALGIASFIAAIVVSLKTGREGFAVIFGGLTAVSILAYFFNRPLESLEENLQFITWLGIIYNTYWDHVVFGNDTTTVHEDLDNASNGAIEKIKELMDKHSERSKERTPFSR